MTYSDETINALAALRTYVKVHTAPAVGTPAQAMASLINMLDDAGVFAALDEQTDYTSATEILAESAARCNGSRDELTCSLALGHWQGRQGQYPTECRTADGQWFRPVNTAVVTGVEPDLSEPLFGRAADKVRDGLRDSRLWSPEAWRAVDAMQAPKAVWSGTCTCGQPGELNAALHAGTCPVWTKHHNQNRHVHDGCGLDCSRPH